MTFFLLPFLISFSPPFFSVHLYYLLTTHLLELSLFNLDVVVALQNHNDHLKEVVGNVREAISIVNGKHKRYLDEIEAFKSSYSKELQEIKHLSGVKKCHSFPHLIYLLNSFISCAYLGIHSYYLLRSYQIH